MEVVASLSQGRTATAQWGLFTHKSVPVIFEPPCKCLTPSVALIRNTPHSNMNTKRHHKCSHIFKSSYSSHIFIEVEFSRRSQWPHGLRRRSAAAHLLRLWVRIPPVAWVSVCCVLGVVCCCLSDKLISRPEESYRLWCVIVCNLETS